MLASSLCCGICYRMPRQEWMQWAPRGRGSPARYQPYEHDLGGGPLPTTAAQLPNPGGSPNALDCLPEGSLCRPGEPHSTPGMVQCCPLVLQGFPAFYYCFVKLYITCRPKLLYSIIMIFWVNTFKNFTQLLRFLGSFLDARVMKNELNEVPYKQPQNHLPNDDINCGSDARVYLATLEEG